MGPGAATEVREQVPSYIRPVEAAGRHADGSSWPAADAIEAPLTGRRRLERKQKEQKPPVHVTLPSRRLSSFHPLAPLLAFVHAAVLRLPSGSDIWRSPRSYCHPLTQLSQGITDTLAQHGGEAQADSALGDKNKAPARVKLPERAKGDV